MKETSYIILGGGPAGLACAYYAFKEDRPFVLLEKNDSPGGNAVTFKKDEFLYDSAAHRWHNVNPNITQDILNLMGTELKKVEVPSSIYYQGKQIAFPLHPIDLLKNLSLHELMNMGLSYLDRKKHSHPQESFAAITQESYGKKVAEAFLWHYTEKLWGAAPETLSSEVSGKRLKGLGLKTFLKKNEEHLDGAFYYPDFGIGSIFKMIQEALPTSQLKTNQLITGLKVRDQKITSVLLSDSEIDTSESIVLNTLSPDLTLRLMGEETQEFQFQDLDLLFLEIDRHFFSPYASIYFPQKDVPFTRMVEPKNRSLKMAPEDKTSLVIEIPGKSKVPTPEIILKLLEVTNLNQNEILSVERRELKMAYPLLTTRSVKAREQYLGRMEKISNLKLLGRNARFSYLHLHDLFQSAKSLF